MTSFDPYERFLGIQSAARPLDYYTLLGLDRFENDPNVIRAAAQRQIQLANGYLNGPEAKHAIALLEEIALALDCLLDTEAKAQYDESLRHAGGKPDFELEPDEDEFDLSATDDGIELELSMDSGLDDLGEIDSGISLELSGSDSGISLEDSSATLGGSDTDLPGDELDEDVFEFGGSFESVEDDDFRLTPRGYFEDDSSGEQVIALDDSDDAFGMDSGEVFESADMDMLESGEPADTFAMPAPAPMAMPSTVVPSVTEDRVHFSAYAPPVVEESSRFLLEVWAFLDAQRQEMERRASRDGKAEEKGGRGPHRIRRGTVLEICVHLDGFEIEKTTDSIQWEGEIANATFRVEVPAQCSLGVHHGFARIFYSGQEIAELSFEIEVGAEQQGKARIAAREERIRTVFASYCSKDESAVLQWVRGAKDVGIDVFMDVLSLRTDADWKEKIADAIEVSDRFCLFWSKPASKSKWVEWEWRHALETRGCRFIQPVPLVSPRKVPPPPDLASCAHFEDIVRIVQEYRNLTRRRPWKTYAGAVAACALIVAVVWVASGWFFPEDGTLDQPKHVAGDTEGSEASKRDPDNKIAPVVNDRPAEPPHEPERDGSVVDNSTGANDLEMKENKNQSAPTPSGERKARTWVDSTGTFKVDAYFVSRIDGIVKLKRVDSGNIIEVPFSSFSSADQQWLASHDED